MEGTSPQLSIGISPKNAYGLRTDVVGNIHFANQGEVIYPVESALAIHNFETNKQKFLRFPEKTSPAIVTISPNRKFLAVVEITEETNYTIMIYDLISLKRKKNVQIPNASFIAPIECICFTNDSKGLAVLTKPPEDSIILIFFGRSDSVFQGKVASNQKGAAKCIACSPNDAGLIAIGGDNLLRLMAKSEKGLSLTANIKLDDVFVTSLAWLSVDTIIVGTRNGNVIIVESSEVKIQFDATENTIIDLSSISGGDEYSERYNTMRSSEKLTQVKQEGVLCMTSFAKGFAFVLYDTVFVYERETKFRFKRKTVLKLKGPENLCQIRNIAINNQEDTIIVTATHPQIYVGQLFVPETVQANEVLLKMLGEPLHVDEIIDISTSAWKPIIMTASTDKTIRIWNYETEKTELVKQYQVQVSSIELHPTGLIAAIGFSDQLRLMQIFFDDLNILKTYNFPRCLSAVFSSYGHLMAAAYDNQIAIISVFSFAILKFFKGHNGFVRKVAWSADDKFLISAGVDGAVYQWDVETGQRLHEIVHKGTEYLDVCVSRDLNSIYAVTNTGILRVIHESEIVREVSPNSNDRLLSLSLSRSDMVMFMSSAKGHLYNVQLPFLETEGGKCTRFKFFNSSVTKLMITYDDTLLISASSNGTLVVWIILNNEGKIAPLDQNIGKCTEVLIPRKKLVDHLENISALKLRMQQQVEEFQHELDKTQWFHKEEIDRLHKQYEQMIKELMTKNTLLETVHDEELKNHTSILETNNQNHQKMMHDLEEKFHEKLRVEYAKANTMKQKMKTMQETYEKKLQTSFGFLQSSIESLNSDFESQLQERQNIISQLMEEMDDKKTEFVEYCKEVDNENDKNIIQFHLKFKEKLKSEQQAILKWRSQSGELQKKYINLNKEHEKLREEVDILKDEQVKYKKIIENFKRESEDFHKDINERELILVDKENKLGDMKRKNTELEKTCKLLNYKIVHLKAQIEPREKQIKEKRNHIAEMEKEIEALDKANYQLEIQITELNEKYQATAKELRTAESRGKEARETLSRISSEIYQTSRNLKNPALLQDDVEKLYKKYGSDAKMRTAAAVDANVIAEFQSQRDYLEKIIESNKIKKSGKIENLATTKLLQENVVLLEEVNNLRKQLVAAKKRAAATEPQLASTKKLP